MHFYYFICINQINATMKSKKRMSLLTAIGLFSLCYCMYSQSNFTFTYDDAGNLTGRIYEVNMQASQARRGNPGIDSSNVVAISDRLKVTIFPNPTKGELKIQVSGVENNAEVDLALYNPNGQLLLRRNVQEGLSEMDLSRYTDGWFLLKVQSGATVFNFKIIKD